MAKKESPEPDEVAGSTFSKRQLMASQRYRAQRDLLDALLSDGRQYSHADVQKRIDEFRKGKVK